MAANYTEKRHADQSQSGWFWNRIHHDIIEPRVGLPDGAHADASVRQWCWINQIYEFGSVDCHLNVRTGQCDQNVHRIRAKYSRHVELLRERLAEESSDVSAPARVTGEGGGGGLRDCMSDKLTQNEGGLAPAWRL